MAVQAFNEKIMQLPSEFEQELKNPYSTIYRHYSVRIASELVNRKIKALQAQEHQMQQNLRRDESLFEQLKLLARLDEQNKANILDSIAQQEKYLKDQGQRMEKLTQLQDEWNKLQADMDTIKNMTEYFSSREESANAKIVDALADKGVLKNSLMTNLKMDARQAENFSQSIIQDYAASLAGGTRLQEGYAAYLKSRNQAEAAKPAVMEAAVGKDKAAVPPAPPEPPPVPRPDAKQAIRHNFALKEMLAVTAIMQKTGCSLKEARAIVKDTHLAETINQERTSMEAHSARLQEESERLSEHHRFGSINTEMEQVAAELQGIEAEGQAAREEQGRHLQASRAFLEGAANVPIAFVQTHNSLIDAFAMITRRHVANNPHADVRGIGEKLEQLQAAKLDTNPSLERYMGALTILRNTAHELHDVVDGDSFRQLDKHLKSFEQYAGFPIGLRPRSSVPEAKHAHDNELNPRISTR